MPDSEELSNILDICVELVDKFKSLKRYRFIEDE